MASMVFAIRGDVQWLKESWKAWILTGVANRWGHFDTDQPEALSSLPNLGPYARCDVSKQLQQAELNPSFEHFARMRKVSNIGAMLTPVERHSQTLTPWPRLCLT